MSTGKPIAQTHTDVYPDSHSAQPTGWLDRLFKLRSRGTNVRTELLAGLTTFMTMSYFIIVCPIILSEAGMPREAATAATIFSSVFCTLIFAFWANFPITMAPGMGLISFFTYTVVQGEGLSWQTALGAVFISGVVFLLLTITGLRQALFKAVPRTLRSSITVGIGLFVAFIGLKNAGIIVANKATFVSLGSITQPTTALAAGGVLLAAFLAARRVKGALLLSILALTVGAMALGITKTPQGVGDIFSLSLPDVSPTFMAMDIKGALAYGIIPIIFSFTIVELFDNMATLMGLSNRAGLMKKDGTIPNLNRALQADAVGTMGSAVMGATALNAYVENATGISEGGRTGLTALVTGVLFLLCLFFIPLVSLIPALATAPILVLVGAMMLQEVKEIPMDDLTETLPAFLTIVMTPLTFSIAEGLAFGFISYTVLKLLTGRRKDLHWSMYLIAAAFIVNFAYHG
ncbi:putative MFS transporter, AGZA family, xanthine/uracil permease [Marininema mesophilum]|uniref:Putative MFS transporter, AGZA family, xanthine/uracil permease n=1 Tax=Marininema mesophilum TaxID=1048340 RepID=A0A1H2QSY5_9BACL|nr:NCS2 family permease [Marininema mesophilum]SDW09990.1 putative MFS transporter, AGZA family, xanthine/uracil permease [Marininema mesophilum]